MSFHIIRNSITSLSFRTWSSPITCPPNLLDGPQTLARLIFFDIPFRIFSAAYLNVEFSFRIIGSLLGVFLGYFVYTLIIGNVSKILSLNFFNSKLVGFFEKNM